MLGAYFRRNKLPKLGISFWATVCDSCKCVLFRFRYCRAMVVTHIHAKNQGLKSVGSKSRKKTDTTTFPANAAGKNREYPLTDVEATAF